MTFEIARRLVQRGDSVEWFSAGFAGAPADEVLEGVRIIRKGRQWTVHWSAFRHYRGRLRQHFDVVIDEVNTIPFFTPIWADVPAVMFIHQLAREVWWYESRFPLNALGWLAEPLYLQPYRNVPVITVSPSTRNDLNRLGFNGTITIIPQGLDPYTNVTAARPTEPRFLYVGRLAPSKRVADLIEAFTIFCHSAEPAELHLVGDGKPAYVEKLRHIAEDLGVSGRVRFLGPVSNRDKHEEMGSAHMLLLASVREGWGRVVTEANSCGTPAVAYNVRGLRDSIHDGETGLLTGPSPKSLAQAMIRAWSDHRLYERLSTSAKVSSSTFSLDDTTSAFRDGVEKALTNAKPNCHELQRASK